MIVTRMVLHMMLPAGVPWSKNGWYIQLASDQWRWVCGICEITVPLGEQELEVIL